ncbi:MAG TPA: IS1595 family transposase [Solirubrobacteraceae bacterium]|jgi:transposase-like protein|nr:IS1595 family transposase [Solirubrobacteraceae bacterium]
MSKVDRNNPKRSTASESTYSLMEFTREFPTDAACLEHLWRSRFAPDGSHADCPKCKRERKFHKVAARPSWSCDTCGHHIHPLAGTIFHKSATSLHLWFYVLYLMTSTRCGISAKQVEREIGVTYKTAWRMCNLIRNHLMAQEFADKLTGEVEADETAYGGRPKVAVTRGMTMAQAQIFAKARKVGIVAMVERGGNVRAYVQPREGALETVSLHVEPNATVYTDEWAGYRKLHFTHPDHRTIRHTDKVYATGDTHTQTIEGWFGNVKNGIAGNYHGVSVKWLQSYVNEYVWRYNHRRRDGRSMFAELLARAVVVQP